MIFFILAILIMLGAIAYYSILIGLPALILWKIFRNRSTPKRRTLWIGFAFLWAIPMITEAYRDYRLQTWIDALPPSPVVTIPAGSLVVLEDAAYNKDTGQVEFAACERRNGSDLCPFSPGQESVLADVQYVVETDDGFYYHFWGKNDVCTIRRDYPHSAKYIQRYFAAQNICALRAPTGNAKPDYRIRLETENIPMFTNEQVTYLKLFAEPTEDPTVDAGSDNAETEPLTTLVHYNLERPVQPVIWGAHWGSFAFLSGTTLHHNVVQDRISARSESSPDFPPLSLHGLLAISVHSQGRSLEPKYQQDLEAQFPYDPADALPALRSRSFFPTKFALQTVCADRYADQITQEIMDEVITIATDDVEFGNGYPKQLAQEILDSDCGAAFRD